MLLKYEQNFTHPEWSRDEATYFYVGDVFCKHLDTMYADFQEKILRGDFFLKIGILSPKVYIREIGYLTDSKKVEISTIL